MESSWLWNVNKTEAEVKRILAAPEEKSFVHYAALLLSRHSGLPKEVFRDFLRKEDFGRHWPAIKRQMRKDSQNRDRIIFWQGVYEFVIREFKKQGIVFPRPKVEIHADPEQRKAGEAIRGLRRSRKMTQAELAQKAGLTQQYIAKIEKGLTWPRPGTLKKIKDGLGVDLQVSTSSACRIGDKCGLGEFRYLEGPSSSPFFIRDASISRPGMTWIYPEPGEAP